MNEIVLCLFVEKINRQDNINQCFHLTIDPGMISIGAFLN